jgi:short-subunit dehydrogenase
MQPGFARDNLRRQFFAWRANGGPGMNLKGKTVWIIGASTGIGRATAIEAARRGARVAVSARSVEQLNEVTATIGEQAAAFPLDVVETSTISSVYEGVLRLWGAVDIVVYAAGISQRSPVRETKLEVYDRIMAVNFRGAVAATLAALPDMLRRGSGHFVVISSLVGKVGTQNRSGYAASKHALHGFFDSLRAENSRAGLKVTLVCPGYVKTEITKRALTGDGSPYGEIVPQLTRGMPVERCAALILNAVEKGRMEINLCPPESYVVVMHRLFPSLVKRLMARRAQW